MESGNDETKELFRAIEDKDTTEALQIIKEGNYNKSAIDASTQTLLMNACKNGLSEVALAIIAGGEYNAEQVDKNGNTALILACYKSLSDVALAIIAGKNYKPEHANKMGNTALIWACKNSLSDVALAIIAGGNYNPEQVNDSGNTALLMACYRSLSDVALAIIAGERDYKPEQVNNNGDTALIWACYRSLSDVALAIIAGKGDYKPEQVNNNDNTALILACDNSLSEVALAIIAGGNYNPEQVNDNGNTALIMACKNSLSDVALAIIVGDGDYKPEQVNNSGNTALILACDNSLDDVALAIIAGERDYKPEQVNKDGNTALIIACLNSLSDVALAIIAGKDYNAKQVNDNGYTALIMACYNSLDEVALAIIAGKDYNAKQVNDENSTALIYACSGSLSEVALAIIAGKENCKLIHFDDDGDTALIIACEIGLSKVALAIIAALENIPNGIDTIHMINNDKNTAFSEACANCSSDVIDKLIEKGAFVPNQRFKKNRTVFVLILKNKTISLQDKAKIIRLFLSQTGSNWFDDNKPDELNPIPPIDTNNTVFDAISHENVPIRSIKNIQDVFIIQTNENSINLIDKTQLIDKLPNLIHYPCNKVDSLNHDFVKFGLPLVYLNMFGMSIFCPLHTIMNMLSENGTFYYLNPTPYKPMYSSDTTPKNKQLIEKFIQNNKPLPSVASVVSANYYETGFAMSAFHCQAGQEQYVYEIVATRSLSDNPNLSPERTPVEHSVMASTAEPVPTGIKVRLNHPQGEITLTVPVNSDQTTFQDVATEIQAELASLGKTPYPISKFLKNGRVFRLNELVKDRDNVLVAVKAPTSGGGTRKKKRSKTRKRGRHRTKRGQ